MNDTQWPTVRATSRHNGHINSTEVSFSRGESGVGWGYQLCVNTCDHTGRRNRATCPSLAYLTDTPITVTPPLSPWMVSPQHQQEALNSSFQLATIQTDRPAFFICFTTTIFLIFPPPPLPISYFPRFPPSSAPSSSISTSTFLLFLNVQDACIPSIQHHTHTRTCKYRPAVW